MEHELENAIYRVAQEALTNAARHARAERVDIRLVERDGRLELAVEDDGVGSDPRANHEGFGLRGGGNGSSSWTGPSRLIPSQARERA